MEDILNKAIEDFIYLNTEYPEVIVVNKDFLKELKRTFIHPKKKIKGQFRYMDIRIIGSKDLKTDEIIIK